MRREDKMRKVIYEAGVSLDGYIADANGSVDWLNRASEKAKGDDLGLPAFFKTIDTVIMGRHTYEFSVKMGMASGFPGMKNYILSRTAAAGQRDGVEWVRALTPLLKKLKKVKGKNIYLCGGGALMAEAMSAGLLDEISMGIVPVMIGGGVRMFPTGFPETQVKLLKCKQHKGDIVRLVYAVVKGKAKKR